MASFKAKATPPVGTYVTLGVTPNDMAINIICVNRDPINSVTVRLGLSDAAVAPLPIPNGDYIEPPDLVIGAGGKLELTGYAVTAGEAITVFNSAATVTWRAHGR
jgi:hypothetical protein